MKFSLPLFLAINILFIIKQGLFAQNWEPFSLNQPGSSSAMKVIIPSALYYATLLEEVGDEKRYFLDPINAAEILKEKERAI